jgi:hypothetical protein
MSGELLAIGQMLSIVVAAVGTPGVTFWVMKRMTQQNLDAMKSGCVVCRGHLEEKIGGLDGSVEELDGRQKELREKTLPHEFVMRRDFEALEKKHDKEVDVIHKRIAKYHPAKV